MKQHAAYKGDEVLDIMNQYAVNRHLGVEKLIRKHLKLEEIDEKNPKRILEFGAGKGEFIDRLEGINGLESWVVELDPGYQKMLAGRHHLVGSIEEIEDESLDGIFLIDVLEHLEDDRAYLSRFFDKLKEGGRLFVYVPARMELFTPFDTSIGHFRRYHKQELAEKAKAAGFQLESLRYHEFLSYFVVLTSKWLTKTEKLKPGRVRLYDRYLVPLTLGLERWMVPPIGKSLYLAGRKG